jgi:peptide/nickel transport system permease protein
MAGFVVRRLVSALLVMFAISVLTFAIFAVIPNGAPEDRMAGRNATPEQVEVIRHNFGFDKPVYVQYARTMKEILTGDLVSYTNQLNVVDEIARGLPATLSLAIGAGVLWMVLGVVFGLLGALKAGVLDRLLTAIALLGLSIPVFWLGALLSYFLGFKWGLFPDGSYVPLTEDPVQWAYHLILPWFTLAFLFFGVYSRVLRANVLDTLGEDHVRTARAKGLSERRVILRHVLRNSLIPIVALFGLDFGAVLGGGAILTESVFNLQGVGQYAATAVGQLDVPPVLGVTMLSAFTIVALSAIVDIVYAFLDPRITLR